jgi:hypothetical protein
VTGSNPGSRQAGAPGVGKPRERLVAAVEPMLEALSDQGRRELERALAAGLGAEPSAAERRLAELGALSEMLRDLEPESGWDYPVIRQAEYDARRPSEAPTGALLASRYEGWPKACRAAYSLHEDGRILGPSLPWATWPSKHARNRPYTREEAIRAVRRCGLELACRPTSTTYYHWVTRKRRVARERGLSLRIPSIVAVYRHFPGSGRTRWRWVVSATAITEDELARAFANRIGLDEVDVTAIDELGDEGAIELLRAADVDAQSLGLLGEGKATALRLSQAVLAARALDCSLDYLTGAVRERGRPPAANLRFDHELYQRRRKKIGLTATRVREVLELSPRDARRLALGTYEPRLRETQELEQMLQLPPGGLLPEDH